MSLPVSLQAVVNEMDMQNEMMHGYINRKTGELISVSEEEEWLLEKIEKEEFDQEIADLPAWQQDIIPKIKEVLSSEDFVRLPTPFDIHEYSIMESFCHTIEDPDVKEELFAGIRGRGAFRMFKDLIFRHGIRDDWFAYKNQALKKIAVDFLEAYDISFEDDGR